MTVERQSIAGLEEEWSRLLSKSKADPLFCGPLWQQTWWDCLADAEDPLLLAVREGETLLGIAPLAQRGGKLSFLAGADVTDYLDFVVAIGAERPFFSAVLDYLQEMPWDHMDLHCLLPTSPALSDLAAQAQGRGLIVRSVVEEVSPVLDLAPDWDSYLAGLRKKDRHELRRKLRRLAESGEVRCFTVQEPDRLQVDMEDFLRLHRLSREEKAVFMTPRMEGFFHTLAERLLSQGQLRLYFLELDGQRVSTAMCFDRPDELLLYNSGFDPSFSHLSVGLLLKAYCIRDAIASGKRRFDFLRGPEPYKYDLGGQDVSLYNLAISRA